jgi:hypothetical protein
VPTHKRARIKTRYFVGRDVDLMHEDERISEAVMHQHSEAMHIPLQEYLDFLRDLRDILNLHREYFLTKMNVFYMGNASPKAK